MAKGDIIVRLLADPASLKRGLKESEASLNSFEGATKRTHSALLSMTAGMIGAGGLAIGFESVISSARKFQDAMEQIHTQAGATQKEVATMSAALVKLGPSVGQTPENLAKGLYHVESAGLRGAKALEVLATAAKGAAIGHADLESVTNALVAAQKSGIKGVQNMQGAMGTLNAIVGVGNMRMGDLAASLSTGILSSARGAGLSLKEIGAALATMTDAGVPAEAAATRLKMAFATMEAPTHAASKALETLGLSQTDLSHVMRTQGMIPALELLKQRLAESGMSAEQQGITLARVFGNRTLSTIQTLLQQLGNVKTKLDGIGAGANGFGEKWAAEQKTAQFASERFHASVSALQVSIGTALLPTLTDGLNVVSKWAQHLNDSGAAAKYAHEGVAMVKTLIQDATPVVETGAKAFKSLADALGGDAHAVEALGGALAAWKLAGVIGAIGGSAGTSAGKVSLLEGNLRRLKTLGALGAITVGIDIVASAHTTQTGLHRYSGSAGWGNLWNDIIGNIKSGAAGLTPGGPGLSQFPGASGPSSLSGVGSVPQTGAKAKDQGAAIAAVAATQLGISYQWGGPAILGQHTDCSGLAQAVLAKNGINVGRTTYVQWGQGRAVAPGDLQAGDLVFFEPGKQGPNHVGIYIGNDQFIEDPHTGASVRVSTLSTHPGYVGARRYTSASASSTTAGPQTGGGNNNAPSVPFYHAPAKKVPILTGSKILSAGLQLSLAKDVGTKSTTDDLRDLKLAEEELMKMPQTLAVTKELATVRKQINAITTADEKKAASERAAAVKAALKDSVAAYKAMTAEVKVQLDAQKAAWTTHIKALQATAAAASQKLKDTWTAADTQILAGFDKTTTTALSKMQAAYAGVVTAFDKATATGLAGLASPVQTPEEKALADFIAQQAANQHAATITQNQANLDAANATGDPVQIKAAQDAINQQSLTDQQAVLQAAADASRVAADKKAAADQQAYQDQRDALKAHMDAQEQILEDGYSNQRAIERDSLDKWLTYQQTQLDAGKTSWSEFYKELAAMAAAYGFDTSGLIGASGVADVAKNAAAAAATATAAIPYLGVSSAVAGGLDPAVALAMAKAKAHIPGFAGGVTNFRGGLALVGERGPELVSLPAGASVHPNGSALVADVPVVVQIGEDQLFSVIQRVTLRNKGRNGKNGLG